MTGRVEGHPGAIQGIADTGEIKCELRQVAGRIPITLSENSDLMPRGTFKYLNTAQELGFKWR